MEVEIVEGEGAVLVVNVTNGILGVRDGDAAHPKCQRQRTYQGHGQSRTLEKW